MDSVDLISKYFPSLTQEQLDRFTKLGELYPYWNAQINVISRKDIDLLMSTISFTPWGSHR